MSPSTPSLHGWRRIPGPPRDRIKARLLRLYVALRRRFGEQRSAGTSHLEALSRPAFTRWLRRRFGGRLSGLRRVPLAPVRAELLSVAGLGRESVDAILLHAAHRPVVVADAPTRRVLARHRLIAPTASYETTRTFLEAHLPSDPALFGELHALFVAVGTTHCRSVPRCERCPLRADLRGRPPAAR